MVIKGPTKAVLILLVFVGAYLGLRHLVSTGFIPSSSGMKTVLALPAEEIKASVLGNSANVKVSALPTNSAVQPCVDGNTSHCVPGALQETEIWAWNANMGLIFATGGSSDGKGIRTSKNSLMEKYRVNVSIRRQDDSGVMQTDLADTALKLKDDPTATGIKYVTIMGDGGAQFFQAINPKLAKLDGCDYDIKHPENPCPKGGGAYMAETIGVLGYSNGEDGFWGPRASTDSASGCEALRGCLIIGVLRVGDWNIAIKKGQQCGVPNNPDDTVFDPTATNWINAESYTKAVEMFIQQGGFCIDIPIKGKIGGGKIHKCAEYVVTWTPGDVTLATKCHNTYCSGAVPIMTTKQSVFQMPCILVGIHAWDQAHKSETTKMLAAALDGADQVRVNPAALDKGGEISQILYQESGASGAYWVKYFKGTVEADTAGVRVPLGGSRVANLADNLQAFGLNGGPNLFAAAYTTFGKIDVQQYPNLIPSFPPVNKILDTSYIQAVKDMGVLDTTNSEQIVTKTTAPIKSVEGQRNYQIQFASGSADILPVSIPVLNQLASDILITNYIVAIHGYTDDAKWAGLSPEASADKNMQLSDLRAKSVKTYLESKQVPNTLRSYAHGQDEQIAGGRDVNRRVKIVLGQ